MKWELIAIGELYDYHRAYDNGKPYFQCSKHGEKPSENDGGFHNLWYVFSVKCDRLDRFVVEGFKTTDAVL